ncbi:Ubiquitin-like modifier-activating enzyme ATG7 [Leucoagaricus sp. SymC.cos]|nr:Ubiquitin-like modifier-activating enzyme ATG7 [Leucoagaricus sp. SymC.cos]
MHHFSRVLAHPPPSADQTNPGWPLRNLLAYLRALYPQSTSTLRILHWRDINLPSNDVWKSRFGVLTAPPSNTDVDPITRPSAVGWEKNPQVVDLSLKFMHWCIIPELNLEKILPIRCLLLGAGIPGSYVARFLMGWGVRTITLVDSGCVSFSNPIRQPLFEFEDRLNGGQPKAECAAARLKKIHPGTTLVSNNSFLLMDSRDGRCLLTVIGAAKDKIVLNAPFGFDTFIIMRHGSLGACPSTNAETGTPQRHYCNDIVVPTDSLTDRALDQMCTVMRPGLAPIAAATLLNFKHVPHQIRGCLAQFRNLNVMGASYDKRSGCSETVLQAYEKEGFTDLLKAFNDQKYFESPTGSDKLLDEGLLEVLGSVVRDEDEDDVAGGGDDF